MRQRTWIGHLPWYRVNTRAELMAVADIGELRARVAGDYSHAETHYTGYERLLKREGVDAVSVCALTSMLSRSWPRSSTPSTS